MVLEEQLRNMRGIDIYDCIIELGIKHLYIESYCGISYRRYYNRLVSNTLTDFTELENLMLTSLYKKLLEMREDFRTVV